MRHKRIIRTFILSSFLMLAGLMSVYAEIHNGIVFRSYESSPSERTSLLIPSLEDKAFSFSDSLRVSFTMKANLNIGKFGYICKVIINESESVDILLYTPSRQATHICATGDHENMISLELKEDQWTDLSLVLKRENEQVNAFLNGQKVSTIAENGAKSSVRICFGQCSMGYFITNDVAPVIISDLCLRVDRAVEEYWKLENEEDLRNHKTRMDISNPVWYRSLNRQWTQLWEATLPSESHICVDNERSCLWFISDRAVTLYRLPNFSSSQWSTASNLKSELITNDFIVLPDGTPAYLDVEENRLIRFDTDKNEWEEDNPRDKHSIFLHDNILIDKENGRYIQMFGYGYHRYLNDVWVWKPEDKSVEHKNIKGISPRYLAAAGIRDGKIYVMGGKGNAQGAQELGAKIYGDLLSIDPEDFSVETIWTSTEKQSEVAAADLIFEPNSNTFLALCYDPETYKSSLQLKRFQLDGSHTSLAQSIPYNFLDIESEARLIYYDKTQTYYAALTYKDDDGTFKAKIYSIISPIVSPSPQKNIKGSQLAAVLICVFILLASLTCVVVLFTKTKKKDVGSSDEKEETEEESAEDVVERSPDVEEPGIYLLGGFKVISKDGKDLSMAFSPLMKQLLCITILNSGKEDGISNASLKDTLWFDKSDESYNNNRGVTLKKIRTILQDVDEGLSIVTRGGYWSIQDSNSVCDYLKAEKIISKQKSPRESLIAIASRGTLLPDLRVDWLDEYKGEYENTIISQLHDAQVKDIDENSAATAIRVADAILSFDSIDEESVRIKCKALIALKRMGSAKKVYDSFRDNYYRVMGETLEDSFSDFVKKS